MRQPIPLSHLTGPPEPERRMRLMEVVRRRARERHFSRRTEEAYVYWIRRFILANDRRHPADLDDRSIRAFLSALAVDHGVAASTQNQALAALTFLYERVLQRPLPRSDGFTPAKRPRRLPVVLTPREIRAVLAALQAPFDLCSMLMYGSGLRVTECMSLRVKDVDFERREVAVVGGKGDKDRRVPLAEACVTSLRAHLRDRRAIFTSDVRLSIKPTGISEALVRKLPAIELEWGWQYIFPATRIAAARDGTRRRHHLHETVMQRAFTAAVRQSGIPKRATCHSLRHSFATHLLEAGRIFGRSRSCWGTRIFGPR